MTVEELKRGRNKLEADILALVKRFEQESGCLVARIRPDEVSTHGGRPETVAIEVEVRVLRP